MLIKNLFGTVCVGGMLILVFAFLFGWQSNTYMRKKEYVHVTFRDVVVATTEDDLVKSVEVKMEGVTVPFYMYPKTESIAHHIVQVRIYSYST